MQTRVTLKRTIEAVELHSVHPIISWRSGDGSAFKGSRLLIYLIRYKSDGVPGLENAHIGSTRNTGRSNGSCEANFSAKEALGLVPLDI